jgi:hypothetical protein
MVETTTKAITPALPTAIPARAQSRPFAPGHFHPSFARRRIEERIMTTATKAAVTQAHGREKSVGAKIIETMMLPQKRSSR